MKFDYSVCAFNKAAYTLHFTYNVPNGMTAQPNPDFGIKLTSENWCTETTITPTLPTLTGIAPTTVISGTAFTLIVTGTHFTSPNDTAPMIRLQNNNYPVTAYTDTLIFVAVPATATQNVTVTTSVPVQVVTDAGVSKETFTLVVLPRIF